MERLVVPFTSVEAAGAVTDLVGRGAEVVAAALDLGQGVPLDELRDVALAAGAVRCHVFERRERLAAAFLWPAVRIGAVAVAGEPIVTALSAPCIAETAVEVARLERATAVAAAETGLRARQRLVAAVRDLAPDLGLIAVAGDGPTEERNLWASVRPLGADEPAAEAVSARAGAAATVVVTVARGVPVALNRVTMPPAEIIDSLDTIARSHGIGGRVVGGGDDAPGRRWLVRAPAAEALHRACAAVIDRSLDTTTLAFLAETAETWARLARDGHWFTRLRGGCDALAAHVLEDASGEVTMTMQHSRIEVAA
ncbi:MAG: argininosuccinate synthase domain-containing protein [Vicinamibacterales bacterium]